MERLEYVTRLNEAIASGTAPQWRIRNPWPPAETEDPPATIETEGHDELAKSPVEEVI